MFKRGGVVNVLHSSNKLVGNARHIVYEGS